MTLLTALTGLRTNNLVGLAAPLTAKQRSPLDNGMLLIVVFLGRRSLPTVNDYWHDLETAIELFGRYPLLLHGNFAEAH
jgi:hypothetical protein